MSFSFHRIGLSKDKRTNVWRLVLPCQHINSPVTTMFAHQVVSCDKCHKQFSVNYNDETMSEVER